MSPSYPSKQLWSEVAAVRERVIATLIFSNFATLAALTLILLAGFGKSPKKVTFTEIDAERINILGARGRPVLILSNRRLMPGPSMNGKDYPPSVAEGRDLLSGMLFFNEQGDEVGGLLFNGFTKGSGPTDYAALGHLSFDQWKQNQVLALQYNDHGTSRRAGFVVWDRPTDIPMTEELDRALRMREATGAIREALRREAQEAREHGASGAQRVFVGSDDRTAQVQLNDTKGRTRARM